MATKQRPQHATSNVFAMFDQPQIQEFKEAFNLIDQNRDGFTEKEDRMVCSFHLGRIHNRFHSRRQPERIADDNRRQVYRLRSR
uniref:EF-hand domain-containing protein n=1 Tax=Podarcis muralis TaxID=64176 RepID=A0A670HVL5_PODMU